MVYNVFTCFITFKYRLVDKYMLEMVEISLNSEPRTTVLSTDKYGEIRKTVHSCNTTTELATKVQRLKVELALRSKGTLVYSLDIVLA